MRYHKLTDPELTAALRDLPGWQVRDGKLHKTYHFASFEAAMAWMAQVARVATQLDHHPEWCNVYNRVTVELTTHDLGNALSQFDIQLAQAMEREAIRVGA